MSEKDAPGGIKSDLILEAGAIPLRWFFADAGNGWVDYDPVALGVQFATPADFEDH